MENAGVSLRSANVMCTEELYKPAAKWGSLQYPTIIQFLVFSLIRTLIIFVSLQVILNIIV
jgi:hypothetical protein